MSSQKNACLSATKIIVPSSPEPHSVAGLYYLDQVLSEIECSIHKIFVTMYDKRTKIPQKHFGRNETDVPR